MRKSASLSGPARGDVGVPLASYRTDHPMFGAAVLFIALTLAVGPNAALLCSAWCHPQSAAATGCHHEDPGTTPSIAADESCDDGVLSAAFLREELRRNVSAQGVVHATLVPRYQLAHSTTDPGYRHEPWREWSLEKRSLATALRI